MQGKQAKQAELSDLELREYRPGDEAAILAGFNRVFRRSDPTFVERDLDEWSWRFLANPAGWRIWLAVTPEGKVVAQQAGIPIRMVHRGEPVTWLQIVDSFADPRYGRGLKKPGLFVAVAHAFMQAYGGPPPGQDQIMYGMPIRPAFRIGRRFLRYQPVRNQDELRCPLDELSPGSPAGVEVEEVERFPAEVDALFARAAREYTAIAVRDRDFLDWRFAARGERRYRLGLARRATDGALLGYAVFRACAFDGRMAGRACDWLVPRDADGARAALLAWLASCARAADQAELAFLLPDTCPDFLALQALGFRVHATSYYSSAGSYTDRFHTLDLFDGWYHTMAEFDLC